MRRKAYVLSYDKKGISTEREADSTRKSAKSKRAQQYINKIARLTTFMDFLRDMPDDPCDAWYRETFPEVSKRTMQRDFAMLNSISYLVEYKRAWECPWDKENEQPVGYYYFAEPYPYGF